MHISQKTIAIRSVTSFRNLFIFNKDYFGYLQIKTLLLYLPYFAFEHFINIHSRSVTEKCNIRFNPGKRITFLIKGVVAICVSDTQYGKKLFDYLNVKFTNIFEYTYYDSFQVMNECNVGIPDVVVIDESSLHDFILNYVDCNNESLRVIVLTEQKDGALDYTIEDMKGITITSLYRYQPAHSICTEITRF